MTDQCLKRSPVPGRVARVIGAATPPMWFTHIQGSHDPSVSGWAEANVVGTDELNSFNIDQAVPEDVIAQEHFAGAALEGAYVETGRGKFDSAAADDLNIRSGDEDSFRSDSDNQGGEHRVIVPAEPDDDVGKLSEGYPFGVNDTLVEHRGQEYRGSGLVGGCGRRFHRNPQSRWSG